jgi:hypothetical protein
MHRSAPGPSARGLALFALVNVLLLNLALPCMLGGSRQETAWADTARVLSAPRTYILDSFFPMAAAVKCHKFAPDVPLYDLLFFQLKTKFQYPPTSLLVMYPTALPQMSAALARRGLDWCSVVGTVSWVLVYVTAALTADVLRRVLAAPGRQGRALFLASGVVLSLTYYPVVRGYSLGQIQVWVNALFAAAVWCWVTLRPVGAGVAVTLMCLFKPHYGILLLWGLLRRQWTFVGAAAVTGAAGLAASVALFGWANHLNYLHVLSYIARHGESYYPNQSVNGLLNRLLHNGPNLEWDMNAFAAYHPLVSAATLATSLALLYLALFGPLGGRQGRGTVLDLGTVVAAATMASPVAWDHHYGVLLPVYAALFGTLWQAGARRGAWLALAFSFALTSNYFPFANRTAATPFNFVQSYTFFGGLLALGMLLRWRTAAARQLPVIWAALTEDGLRSDPRASRRAA